MVVENHLKNHQIADAYFLDDMAQGGPLWGWNLCIMCWTTYSGTQLLHFS
jgi:hypothetical protein